MEQLFWESLLVTVVLVFFVNQAPIATAANPAVPALFAFGDSILDTGNNNGLLTLTKCNFYPYGKNFPGGRATGRFCNGKIPSDLIASALGIKEVLPAYLDPYLSNEDIPTGVSFASGGSGNDDMTCTIQGGVLKLSAQLGNFQEYLGKLRSLVGQQRAADIISKAVFLISSGNNDIAITHSSIKLVVPIWLYSNTLVSSASNFIQNLYNLGARRVWVLSTLPLGCLPGARTAAGGPLRICAPFLNLEAQTFNSRLSAEVNSLKSRNANFDIRFVDVYNPMLNIIQNPAASGFVNVDRGCCATGTVELGGLCNLLTGSCLNPSQYFFWDAGHPTERAYQLVVSSIMQSNHMLNFSASH